MTNPWLEPDEELDKPDPVPAAPAFAPPGAEIRTRGSGLPAGPLVDPDRLCVVAAHGGAGATTWAHLLDAVDCGAAWPTTSIGETTALLVARTSATGLDAALRVGLQWNAGLAPDVNLIGLLLAPDAPGRPLKALRDLETKVRAIYPRVFTTPYMDKWRTLLPGEVPAHTPMTKTVIQILGDQP